MSLPIPESLSYIVASSLRGASFHPSTSPDAIVQAHQAAIRELIAVWREAGFEPTVEQIGECCDLPMWTVARRLEEMAKSRKRKAKVVA